MILSHKTRRTAAALVILVLLAAYPLYLALAANSGPINAGAGVDVDNGSLTAWSNPGGITAAGIPLATASVPLQSTSHFLQATQYGFAIPVGSIINGITVEISRMSDGGANRLIRDSVIRLVKGGVIVGDNKANLIANWSLNVLTTASYGGPADKWGTTWTPEDINADNFGVVLSVFNSSEFQTRLASVDTIKITIEYTPPSSTTSVDCGSGVPALTYGSSITCVATVTGGTGNQTPTGTVVWTTDGSGYFTTNSCALTGSLGTSTCSVNYTPTQVGDGSHLITATYSGDGNFSTSSGNQGVTVNQRPITVAADPKSKVYGETDPGLTYHITDGTLVSGDTFSGALSRLAGEDVGDHTIQQGSLALSPNYALTFLTANLNITPRPITVTADAKSKTYGDNDPELTYQVTGNLVFGDIFTGNLIRLPGEDVGGYAIQQGSLALSTNYSLTYVGDNLTITTRPISVTADAKNKVYGELDPTLTYQHTGILVFGDTFSGDLSRVAGEIVGSYAIEQGTLALSANYDLSYTGNELSITPRPITVTAEPKTRIYGDTDPALTYQVTGTLAFTDVFLGELSRVPGEGVGIYAIEQGTLALSTNYALTYFGDNLTITKRQVTVTADAKTKVYGDPDPAFTYLVTSGSVVFDDTFSGTLNRVEGENIGPYAIQQNTLSLSDNYELTYQSAVLTITTRPITITAEAKTKVYGDADPALTFQITSGNLVGADAFSGALSRVAGENVGAYAIQQNTLGLSENYNLAYIGADLSITRRPVTVTAHPKSKTYGEADPIFTYQVTSGSLVSGDNFSGALGRAAGENVGVYAIQLGSLAISGNYDLSLVSANLTITRRPVVVKADATSKIYGEADPEFTYQRISGTLVTGDGFSGALSRVAGENVSAYAIQKGTLVISDNYDLTFISDNLTITPRSITVTADALSKIYGEPDPTLTYQLSVSLAFNDAFTGALSRLPGVNVGTYAIQQGTLALTSNYNLAFVGANFTINKRPITVTADAKSKAWGEPDPQLTYQVTSGSVVLGDAFTGALIRISGEDIGTYAIAQGTLALSNNYDITYVGASLTITKATPTLSVTNSPVSYNGTPQTAVVVASVNGLVENIKYNGASTPPTDAGTYAITADFTPADTEHYISLTGASAGNFVITQKFWIFLPVINR